MKIFFTKKEYRVLVEMLYLADWVMNSHHLLSEEINVDHKILYKKLLAYSVEMKADDITVYDKNLAAYYLTKEHDEYLREKHIEPYEEEIFWENLIDRLSRRDVINKVGMDKFQSMDLKERFTELGKFEEKYNLEFETHGLENVILNTENITIEGEGRDE